MSWVNLHMEAKIKLLPKQAMTVLFGEGDSLVEFVNLNLRTHLDPVLTQQNLRHVSTRLVHSCKAHPLRLPNERILHQQSLCFCRKRLGLCQAFKIWTAKLIFRCIGLYQDQPQAPLLIIFSNSQDWARAKARSLSSYREAAQLGPVTLHVSCS